MARDCPIGVETGIGVFVVVVVVVACMGFPQTLVKVWVLLVCGCFFGHFVEHWCVCGVSFLFLSITSA